MKSLFLITLGCVFFALSVGRSETTQAHQESLKQLNTWLKEASVELNQIKAPEQVPQALNKLVVIEEQLKANGQLADVLLLDLASCPQESKASLEQLIQQKAELKDVAKRLAMSGLLQGEQASQVLASFIALVAQDSLKEGVIEQQSHEGAPPESFEARQARMKWWREGKFGMFIHYGLYSGLGGEVQGKKFKGCVEWIQQYSGLDSDTYAKLALPLFNPQSGQAQEWVKLAKEAGCAYTVLTARHHEGFNLFDTSFSDFNVKKLKGIDVIKEYSQACQKYQMKAGYYFSLIDWSHPDYDPTGSGISYPQGNYEAQKRGEREFGHHEKYKEYLCSLFNELLTHYQPIDLIWWDFSQPNFQGDAAWGATKLMSQLFAKYPKAIQNNRLYHSENHLSEGGIKVTPTWKGDYSTAEHHIPATGIDGDWEACQTLNGTWGYSADNQCWKTSSELIHELIDTVSRGGNFLLNIGPKPDGSIPEESIRLFKEIGAWMKINHEAIYGTQANPLDMELSWGRLTRKGDSMTYIFAYKKPSNHTLTIPCTFDGVPKATLLAGGKSIKVTQDKSDLSTSFDISDVEMPPAALVIKVEGKRVLRPKKT